MLYAEHCFEKKINMHQSNLQTSEEIAKLVNALMNTSGGLILLHCGDPPLDKKRDEWLRNFKDHATKHWIPFQMYRLLISVKYKIIGGQFYLFLFVDKSAKLVTFSYNAYGRHAGGIKPITEEDDIKQMIQRTNDSSPLEKPRSRLNDLLEKNYSFTLDESLPVEYCESQTMEFKHYEINDFSARKIEDKLSKERGLWENISAFANTEGGSLVVGVKEEKTGPIVKGYQVTDNQEEEQDKLTQYINEKLRKCIWNGKQPGSDTYWNVFYHDVKLNGQKERKVIEISVHQVSGGMFYKAPVHYMVGKDVKGKGSRLVEMSEFNKWKLCVCPELKTAETNNKKDRLEKHVVKDSNFEKDETKLQVGRTEINKTGEDQNMKDFSHEDISHDTKTRKSFRESKSEYKTDIKVENLSVHACCIKDMVKELQSFTGEHVWYPSIKSTLKRTGVPPNCEKILDHINQQRWEGIANVLAIQPKFHTGITKSLCDVLVMSKHGSPKVICCFKKGNVPDADKIGYALKCGRELKEQFLMSTFNTEHLPLHFHFDIQVITLTEDGSVSTTWDSQEKQKELVNYTNKADQSQYHVACTGLAERLLHTDHSLKNCRGEVLMEHLTAEQARLILERKEEILIVRGKSGTGKTAVALTMIQEAKAEAIRENTPRNMLYICASVGVQAFVESQQLCTVWNMNRTDSLSDDQKSTLESYHLVVVDDAHAIVPGERWQEDNNDLYRLLFTHSARTEVAIFFDPFQDFTYQLPDRFDEKLRNLALSTNTNLETDQIQIYTLKKRIRNSREINSFIQANQNQANISESVPCLNERDGDDITYCYIGTNIEEIASAVDAILHRLTQQFEKDTIVILCDDKRQLEITQHQLMTKFDRHIQNGTSFPVTDTMICQLDDFGGLEADVVLFLLPPNWGLDFVGNWRYVYCVSSRAILRLEFLLPWDPTENQHQRDKLEQFLELFKTVSTIFFGCTDCMFEHQKLWVVKEQYRDICLPFTTSYGKVIV